jgi:hypothetical protein
MFQGPQKDNQPDLDVNYSWFDHFQMRSIWLKAQFYEAKRRVNGQSQKSQSSDALLDEARPIATNFMHCAPLVNRASY